MRQEVKLYIRGMEVEFSEPFHIAMSFDIEDIKNPTAVKNNYSKTVRVEGTNQNNIIFSSLFDVTKTTLPIDFNPLKKEPFELLLNGEKVQEGYVKLDKVERKGNLINYYITLYGGLGDFFYCLQYDAEGNKRTLADLDYGRGRNELSEDLNMYTVGRAWNYLAKFQSNPQPNDIDDKLQFAITNDGVPSDNFDANKVLCQMSGNPWGVTPAYEAKEKSWFIAEMPNSYTQAETRDIRSRFVRPMFRFKYFIQAIADHEQNGGYTVNLDPTFFSKNNRYYENAWMTLPTLPELSQQNGKQSIPMWFDATEFDAITKITVPMKWKPETEIEMARGDIEIPFRIDVRYTAQQEEYLSSGVYLMNGGEETWYYSRYYVQAVANSPRYGEYASDIVCVTSNGTTGFTNADFGFKPLFSKPVKFVTGVWRPSNEEEFLYKFDNPEECKVTIPNFLMEEGTTVELRLYKGYNTTEQTHILPEKTFYRPRKEGESIWDAVNQLNVIASNVIIKPRFDDARGNYGGFSEGAIDTVITKKKLLTNEYTPLDYLLSYAKMFGLMFVKDTTSQTIDILSRKTFYNQKDNIVDLTKRIDYSKPYIVYPLAFNKKWMTFTQPISNSDTSDKYTQLNGSVYGEQKVDTNYNFDFSSKNLLEGNVLRNGVMMRPRTKYNVNTPINQLPIFLDGANFKTWDRNDELQEANVKSIPPQLSTSYTPLFVNNYTNWMMLDTQKDRKTIDAGNIMCFFDIWEDMKDVNGNDSYMKITDDIPDMLRLNENRSCWLSAPAYGIRLAQIPIFSRYYTMYDSITDSFEMGTPVELYTSSLEFNSNPTIYDQYWKNFIRDQYLLDTKIVECWIMLEGRVMEDYLRKIFYFDNCYWALLNITDYDICDYKPTKCTFIKINNLESYTR